MSGKGCDGNCKNCKVTKTAERLRPLTREKLAKLRKCIAERKNKVVEYSREKTKDSMKVLRVMLRKEIVKEVKKAISPMLANNVSADVKAEIEKVLEGIAEKKEEEA